MRDKLMDYQKRGVSSVAFGDIFLEDLKEISRRKLIKDRNEGNIPYMEKRYYRACS